MVTPIIGTVREEDDMAEVDTAPRPTGLRRTPWGANIARQVAGDPYVNGVEVTEGESAMQAMTRAGLDWKVELNPIRVTDGQDVPGYFAVTRGDSGLPLSIVKGRYRPFQNPSLFSFVDSLVDTGASSLVGAGEVDQGRRVFSIVKLDKEIRPLGIPEELIDIYLLVTNHHTGGASLQASVMPLRLACTNGMRFTVKRFATTWKVRHVTGMEANVVEAQKALSLTIRYADRFEEEIQELVEKSITEREFSRIVEKMFPPPEDVEEQKKLDTMQANRREQVTAIYFDSPDMQNIRGTGYGVVNAFAEWEQWSRPFQKKYQTREFALLNQMTRPNRPTVNAATDRALALVRAI